MIEGELARLRGRLEELKTRIIPGLENSTSAQYASIMSLQPETREREKLESEYAIASKELRRRYDEIVTINQQIDRLETQNQPGRKPL